MDEKFEFRKPDFCKPTKVRKALDAVAFVNDKNVIGFKLENAGGFFVNLEMDATPEAKLLYDFFNEIFGKYARQQIESGGLSKKWSKLTATWSLEEEKVPQVIHDIGERMKGDWGKAMKWLFEKS